MLNKTGDVKTRDKKRIIFFGSSDFSADILAGLKDDFDIVLLVTRPDRAVGRHKTLRPGKAATTAAILGIPILKPEKLATSQIEIDLRTYEADLFIVAAYGKIIPENLLKIPKFGAINVHPSLLPLYRGPCPIQAALMNGDAVTGVSIILMDKLMDHGPIIARQQINIKGNETYPELQKELCGIAIMLLKDYVPKFIQGSIRPVQQEHSKATYCKIINRQNGQINWQHSAYSIYNLYRALIVWPGIWTIWKTETIKIMACEIFENYNTFDIPGKVKSVNNDVIVCCARGSIKLLKIQTSGGHILPTHDFLNGHKDFIGSILE